VVSERELKRSIDRIYELYLYELRLFLELRFQAESAIDRAKQKKLATEEDLQPNLRFIENTFFTALAESVDFQGACEKYVVSWADDRELIRSLFEEIRRSDVYAQYMSENQVSFDDHKRFVRHIYDQYILRNELFHQHYEEKNMHWADDLDAAQMMVEKTLKRFKVESKTLALVELYKDDEDTDFGRNLFRKTLVVSEDADKRIISKSKNWESDRIAALDIILMKMALAEFQYFSSIPLKVTMNEYIELAKQYSTPKSSVFINGILDKILKDMKTSGDIHKVGRGLLES
jgi:N utilization substance protein B